MPQTRAALILALAAAVCARPPPPRPKVEAPPDPKTAIGKLLKKAYADFERAEPEEWSAAFSAEAVVYGPGASDTLVGREAIAAHARSQLVPIGLSGRKVHWVDSKPIIAVARSETSAWVADFPTAELRDEEDKLKGRYRFRLTAHAIDEGASGRWALDAVHVSVGFPNDDLYRPAASDKLGIPRALEDQRGPGTDPLVDLLRKSLKSLRTKIDRTSQREEVVLIGTDPDELFQGGKVFHDWAVAQLPAAEKAAFTQRTEGGIAARVAPDGQTAWVATQIVLTIGTGKKALTAPPFRALMIFEKGEADWDLVSDHQSVGVPSDLWKKAPPRAKDEPAADGGPPAAADAGR